ncbi:MAG: hypothetical protein ACI9DC_002836 [Gammaproteobacteria bacterium]|jgi:hypothetical protein
MQGSRKPPDRGLIQVKGWILNVSNLRTHICVTRLSDSEGIVMADKKDKGAGKKSDGSPVPFKNDPDLVDMRKKMERMMPHFRTNDGSGGMCQRLN